MSKEESQLVDRWNKFCENNNCLDDQIYYNDEEFFEMFNLNIRQVSAAVKNNRYNFDHEWVTLDGYANPMSSNTAEDFMDIEEMDMEEWLEDVEF